MSRTVNAEYWQRQCSLYFPEVNGYTFGSAKGKTEAEVNAWTKGWELTDTTRLIWANGYDHDNPYLLGFLWDEADSNIVNMIRGDLPVFPPLSDLEGHLSRGNPPH